MKNISIMKRFHIILVISALFPFIIWTTIFMNSTRGVQYVHIHIPIVEDKNVSTWLDYRDHWNGEVLLSINLNKTQILFTEEYHFEMTSKGPHPLNLKYDRYLKRIKRLDQYCSAFESNSQGKFDVTIVNYRAMFIDKAKLLICSVPKASSSTWLNMMMNLEEDTNLKTRTMVSRDDPIWKRISLTQNL